MLSRRFQPFYGRPATRAQAPSKEMRDKIVRIWARRFGLRGLQRTQGRVEGGGEREATRMAAAFELDRATQLLGDWRAMQWQEIWRLLHRIKGTIDSTRTDGQVLATTICSHIDALRPLTETPEDFAATWAQLGARVASYHGQLLHV